MNEKQCILIFGMHRSGTSLIGKIINTLGYEGGERLMGAAFDNEGGFYEDHEVVSINDALLDRLGFNWMNYSQIDEVDFRREIFDDLRGKGRALIKKYYKSDTIFIKDPRLCITAPFWIEILEERGFTIKSIFCLRDPQSIYSSLSVRNLFSKSKSYWLTWVYWVNALMNFKGRSFLTIPYGDIGASINIVSQSIAEYLSIDPKLVENAFSSNYQRKLRHHTKVNIAEADVPVHRLYKQLRSPDMPIINPPDIENLSMTYEKNIEEIKHNISKADSFIKVIIEEETGPRVTNYPWADLDDEYSKVINISSHNNKSPIRLYVYTGVYGVIQINILEISDEEGIVLPSRLECDSQNVLSDLLEIDYKGIWFNISNLNGGSIHSISLRLDFHNSISTGFRDFQKANSKDDKKTQLLEIAKSPLDVLSEVNLYNFQRMRRALRNESFSQVARNARNYIIRKIQGKRFVQQAPAANSIILSDRKDATIFREVKPHTFLFILPEWPMEDRSSGERRTLEICRLLSKNAVVGLYSFDRLEEQHSQTLTRRGYVIYESVKTLKSLDRNTFQSIIISKYFNLRNSKKITSYFHNARVIVDSVDVNWIKEENALSERLPGFTKRQVSHNKEEELKAYQEADEVWVVTDTDKEKLLKEGVDSKITVVSNIHELDILEFSFSKEKNLIFIGGYNYYANRASIKWIVEEVFPKIQERDSECTLLIAGSGVDDEICALGEDIGVRVIGHIPEGSLEDFYRSARVALVPLLVGSGIKGKVCEAIAHGVPVVTNDVGNEGIKLIDGVSAIIGNTPNELLAKTCDILDNAASLEEISRNARAHLRQIVSPEIVEESLIDSLFPKVTLCVITWNGIDLLRDCIESIEEFTNYPNYEVQVYSNGCTDGTQQYLADLSKVNGKIKPILSKDNEVFVRPNNKMMYLAGDSDVVLLNNDILVTDNWLSELQIAAYSNDKIGIAGSKLLYGDGTLQEYGCSMGDDGNGINHGKGDTNPFREEYASIRAVGYVSGCSFYIKRSTINRIGVLDDDFHPIYCEDSDYCYSAWKEDMVTVVAGRSVIYHLEGATNGTDTSKGLKKHQVKNYQRFMSKHGSELRSIERKVKKANSIFSKTN